MQHTNLLFIFTDEQRFDTLAAYGNARIHMPNLNRLASESTVFERAYVTQPVCTPSRGSLMTGLYPHTHGASVNNVPLADNVACLPEMLTLGRYATGYHGKWHLGDEIFAQHGFDEWVSIEDGYLGYYREGRDRNARSSYYHFLRSHGLEPADGFCFARGEAARLPEQLGKPAFLAGEASKFIREHRRDPFVLYVNFLEPHMPFYGPRDNQYDPAEVDLPANFDALLADNQHLKSRLLAQTFYHYGFGGDLLRNEDEWRQLIARYWGLCSLVDTHVGRILQTVEECSLLDNTIIVFTSDHGDMMGSHRLVGKGLMFEEAVRVPLLVRLPGQTEGRSIKTPVSQIDVAPTLLDLLDESVPSHLQGKSLRPTLESGAEPPPDAVFIEWEGRDCVPGYRRYQEEYPDFLARVATKEEAIAATADPVRTIVTPEGWKLNYSPLGMHELYNLNKDPHETSNLAAVQEHKWLMDELIGRIRAWQESTADHYSQQDHMAES